MSFVPATPLRILHVEDVPADAELAERELLQAGFVFETRRVETREAFLAALSDFAPDLILSDYRLPAFDGMQAVLLAKEHSPDVPFIITTGRVNEETAVACMKAGAADYVLKDHLGRLGTAVRSALERQRLLAEQKRAENRIRQLNRLLKTISEVNQLIVRTDDRQTLLSSACRILVEHGGFRMAWVGLADREKGLVLPAARAGDAAHYLEKITVRFDETPEGRGPVGAAIRTERHVVVADLAAEATVAPWRERMLAHGFRTVGVFPFPVRGEVAGTLTVYLSEPGAIDDEETTLLDELAADLGYALETLEIRAERKRAEEALRASQKTLRTLIDSSPDVVILLDTDGRVIACNQVLAQEFGKEIRELIGHSPFDLMPADAASYRRERVKQVIETGRLVRDREERSGRIYDVILAPIKDEGGHVVQVAIFVREVTDLERVRAELAKSELYYRSLIEHSLDITAVLGPGGEVRYMSSSVKRILGYAPEELQGSVVFDIVHPEDRPEAQEKLRRILQSEAAIEAVEARLRHRDGPWRTLSVTGKLLPPEIGELGLIVSARDITERQQLEAQLLQAQKMEAVGRLAGGVAHDFNNLLTVIQGYGEMLARSLSGDETRREEVAEILNAAARATTLTRQLLAFSRRQVLEMRVFDLGAVVGELQKMLRRLIGENVELVVVRSAGPAFVKADPGQIEQVLLNLAVNARDAMPKGGRLNVEVADLDLDSPLSSLDETVLPGRYVVVSVSDAGTGMDSETLGRIFEPFFTTKEKGKGTGLGLSTVFGIVKQSSGHVLVESAPGRGTTFRVFLPRVDGEGAAVAPILRTGASAKGSETILVVEDELQIRALIRASLAAYGYTVLDAASAEEALGLLAQHAGPLDLLLTDVVLKGDSGRTLADRLLAQRPGVKVLYMSGYTDNVISHHGVLEPGLVFLQKPFTPAALARKVREALESRPDGEGTPSA